LDVDEQFCKILAKSKPYGSYKDLRGGRAFIISSTCPLYRAFGQLPEEAGYSGTRIFPKLQFGRTVLQTKCGCCSYTNAHTDFSASALLDPYTAQLRASSYGGGAHAALMSLLFQRSVVMLNSLFGLGAVAAVEEEV
jgi:hypothetical protein